MKKFIFNNLTKAGIAPKLTSILEGAPLDSYRLTPGDLLFLAYYLPKRRALEVFKYEQTPYWALAAALSRQDKRHWTRNNLKVMKLKANTFYEKADFSCWDRYLHPIGNVVSQEFSAALSLMKNEHHAFMLMKKTTVLEEQKAICDELAQMPTSLRMLFAIYGVCLSPIVRPLLSDLMLSLAKELHTQVDSEISGKLGTLIQVWIHCPSHSPQEKQATEAIESLHPSFWDWMSIYKTNAPIDKIRFLALQNMKALKGDFYHWSGLLEIKEFRIECNAGEIKGMMREVGDIGEIYDFVGSQASSIHANLSFIQKMMSISDDAH